MLKKQSSMVRMNFLRLSFKQLNLPIDNVFASLDSSVSAEAGSFPRVTLKLKPEEANIEDRKSVV